MTLFIADIASYQGGLKPADLVRAGFGAVNVKISHGLGQTSVHPQADMWAKGPNGLGVCTFHFLTATASGFAQARYAYSRMLVLGVPAGAAHQIDTEDGADWQTICDYVTGMRQLLGRPPAGYSGRWWWSATGRRWDASALFDHLWSAPMTGYLPSYPGDTAGAWVADYAGFDHLSALQYAVGPVTYPDGTRGTIDVSKSAIRDPGVWADLTTRRSGMTAAPASLKAARTLILTNIPSLDPLAVGIVGDDNHAQTGSSYHLGKSALKPTSYSIVESSRDRDGLSEDAAALDFGWFAITVNGKAHNLRTYSAWVVAQCVAGAPDTADIREIIYSLDGKTVKRWDRLKVRTTGDDTHLTHTHHSWFRDSTGRDKTALFRRYFTEIGLIKAPKPPEDTVEAADIKAIVDGVWARLVDVDVSATGENLQKTGDVLRYTSFEHRAIRDDAAHIVAQLTTMQATTTAVAAAVAKVMANVQADDADTATLLAAVNAAQVATIEGVLAGLTGPDRSDGEIADALAVALGDRFPGVAAAVAQRAGR